MAGSVLILTAILGSAAATKLRYGRDAEWKPSAPTSTLDATGPDRWTHLRVSPRPTEGPNLDLRDVPLLRRDHIGIETCGFYPEDGMYLTITTPSSANSLRVADVLSSWQHMC